MVNQCVKIVPLKTNTNPDWQFEFLEESFNKFNSENNFELIDIEEYKDKAFYKKVSCDTALQLMGLKKYLNKIDECYIFLTDLDLIFINTLGLPDESHPVYASSFGFSRFNIKSKQYTKNFIEFDTIKNLIFSFYKKNINLDCRDEKIEIFDFPVLITKSLLNQIIDRWIELAFILYSSKDGEIFSVKNRKFTYNFAFSLALSEFSILPKELDIVYFNSIGNSNSENVLYDIKDDLIVNTSNGAITLFKKSHELNEEIYSYKNDQLNKYQSVFMELINNFIIKNKIKATIVDIIPV